MLVGKSDGGASNQDFAVVRYNVDGSLDTTFGVDGKVTTDLQGGRLDEAFAVAIQSDGKILVVGDTEISGNFDFAVLRYSTWSLDTTFDGDGKVITPIGSNDDRAFSVAVQSDGKIVVAGLSGDYPNRDFAVVRYNADGSLDTTFDGDGKVVTPVGTGDEWGLSVAMQSDSKIVVAGPSHNGSYYDFALVRYNADGSLDTAFDVDGKAITHVGSSWYDDYAESVAIQPDGKIVVAGTARVFMDDFAVVRYNSDGSLDTSFDPVEHDGKVITDINDSWDKGYSVAIQSDGKIVVAGDFFNGTDDDDFAVVRYNADGSLDTGFDNDGKLVTPIGSSSEEAQSVAIQSDGRIVAAGFSYNSSDADFALVRYDASLTAYTEGDGAKVIDGFITITDPDSANMASATIQITGNYQNGEDVLSIDVGDLLGVVTDGWNSATGTLTLIGSATRADYESMLEHVRYANSSDNPNTAPRPGELDGQRRHG